MFLLSLAGTVGRGTGRRVAAVRGAGCGGVRNDRPNQRFLFCEVVHDWSISD